MSYLCTIGIENSINDMKRLFAFLIVTVLCSFTMSAARQDNIVSAKLVDKNDGSALGWATVAVRDVEGNITACTTTDENGKFQVNFPSSHKMTISLIGYKDVVLVSLADGAVVEMEVDRESLAAATVTTKIQLVEMKVDKVVMNVSQSAFAQGSTGMDLIKKAPGVVIDKDGNITLNGKSVAVWIDGRPSYMDGKALEALLRSTPGTSIEKFELIANPSSKYDAQGQGGIINIKTKKNALAGFNGSLGATVGGMYFGRTDRFLWQEDFWANINYRSKKTNTFLNVYEGDYKTDMNFATDLETVTEMGPFRQRTESLQCNDYKAMNIKLGNDWFIDDKNIFGVILNVPGSWNFMGRKGDEPFNGSSVQEVAGLRTENLSATDNDSKSLTASANVNYTHIFDEAKSSEITANLDWYRTGSKSYNTILSRDYIASEEYVETDKVIDNNSTVSIYSAKADWQTMCWKNAMLEAGGKWAGSFTDNKMLKTETSMPDNRNDFTYQEHIAALYVSIAKPFGKFSVKAGLRGEYTHSYGDWKTAGTDTRRSYFDLFPTVFAGWNPSQNFMMNLSYTRRIQRPNYYNLNPAEQYVDAHSFVVGNPDLKPQYTNSVSLSAVFFKNFSVAVGYDHNRDMFNQLPSYRQNGDQILTWGNFGYCHMAFLSANISGFQIAKWLQWTLNLNGLYSDNIDVNLRNRSFMFAGYTDFTFILPKDWKIQIDGRYNSPMTWGYFRLEPVFVSNLGIKKNFLENRLTLSLDVDNLFRSQKQDLTVVGGADKNVTLAKSYLHYDSQKVKIGVSYNFGQAQRTRYRKVGNLEESSRTSGTGIGG